MRYITVFIMSMAIILSVVSCKPGSKEMTLSDYSKIESEISLPDPDLDPERVEKVAGKYGYSFKQYKDFFDKVEKDPSLRTKLGELRLKGSGK